MKTKSLLSRKVQLAFGSAILALFVVGAISCRGTVVSSESDRWVRHTHEVLENLQDLLSAMQSAESSYRGFVLTGTESYLDLYRASMLRSEQEDTIIRDLTVDNALQQRKISALERLATQNNQYAVSVIALRRVKGLEAAADSIRDGKSQQIMDEYREVIREMQDEELRLLALRDAEAKRRLGQTKIILILGTVLGLLIAGGAGWSVQRESSARWLAEEALQRSEEKYRMLLDAVQEYAIFMLDPRGQIMSWNAGAERIKGYKAGEIIGHSFHCFFPPEDIKRGRPEELLRMAAASGRHEYQGMRVRKNGSRFLASITFTALRDTAGNLRGFFETSRDLSESKESGAKYRGLLEAAPDAMVVVNQRGEIVLLNVQAEKQFGYYRDELIGQKVKNIIPEGFAERLIADALRSTEDALAQQIGTGIELTGRRKNGSEFPIEIMLSPLESAEGTLVTAAIRDISVRKGAEQHLAQMEGRYRGLLEAAPDAIVVVNQGGEIVLLNVQAEKQFGYRRDELVGQKVKNIIPEGFAERLIADALRSTEDALAQQIGTGIELTGRRKNGSEFPIEIMLSPLETEEGLLVSSAIRDITDRKRAEEALFLEKERAQVTLNCIGDAVICTDARGNITFLNLVAEKMTGWSRQEAGGRRMADVFRIMDAASRTTTPNPMEAAFGQNRTVHLPSNCILIRRDGFEIPIEDSVAPIHDRKGQATGAVIVFRDVSAARAMALEIVHSAQHDFLTGLPNRLLLNDRVSQAIAFAQRHAKKVAVLFLDLDGFKHINDSLGHPIGDKLLQSISKRLVDCVRGSDTVSRQGGDEFVVLLSEVEQSGDAAITAGRMLRAVAEAHAINQHDLHITTSIGVSVYPDDGQDAEALIKNADTAMYQAKENGRQSYQFFKPAMNVRAVERQSIEESLRSALERREFALHYQPKINLRTGEITGAEALIRWTHPLRGPIPPGQFIPVAEECGLILPIGNWVLREACKQARAWTGAGLPSPTMAVNISAMEFRDEHFLEGVFAILKDTDLDPGFLELELTESVLMKRAASTESILKALRARGVRVAVDDFGTGYSSLSYLRKFPIDALKIDQSFVRQITSAPDETAIVTAIISAATINGAGGGTMVGTIIAMAGITFSTAGNNAPPFTVLDGRALVLVGPVTMVNTVINVP